VAAGDGRGRGRKTPVPDWESEKVATLDRILTDGRTDGQQ